MTEKTMDFDPKQVKTITVPVAKIVAVQRCMLCENSRELPDNMSYSHYPWVCNECKEAIAFVKDFMKSCDKAKEMLDEMRDPTKNIYPL